MDDAGLDVRPTAVHPPTVVLPRRLRVVVENGHDVGNTFVLKPSELTPHTALLLMQLLDEAGLPSGVANLVLGAGPRAGAPLAEDPRVDLLSFTGGLATGRLLTATAAATVKKVALELGGKNPNIVFAHP